MLPARGCSGKGAARRLLSLPATSAARRSNGIKEGNGAIKMDAAIMPSRCANALRLQFQAVAYNLQPDGPEVFATSGPVATGLFAGWTIAVQPSRKRELPVVHPPELIPNLLRQVAERNPYFTFGATGEILPTDLLVFLGEIRIISLSS